MILRGVFKHWGKEKPLPLINNRCGDAYCPRCSAWLSEYHWREDRLDEYPKRYCDNCGQRLVWKVKE